MEVRIWYARGIIPRVVTMPFVGGRMISAPTNKKTEVQTMSYVIGVDCGTSGTKTALTYHTHTISESDVRTLPSGGASGVFQ